MSVDVTEVRRRVRNVKYASRTTLACRGDSIVIFFFQSKQIQRTRFTVSRKTKKKKTKMAVTMVAVTGVDGRSLYDYFIIIKSESNEKSLRSKKRF